MPLEQIREITCKMEKPVAIIGTRDNLMKVGVPIENIKGGSWHEFKIIEINNEAMLPYSDKVYMFTLAVNRPLTVRFEY